MGGAFIPLCMLLSVVDWERVMVLSRNVSLLFPYIFFFVVVGAICFCLHCTLSDYKCLS